MCRWVLVLSVCAAPAAFAAVQFFDDFSRPDGPLTEWVQAVPIARIESERLVLEPDPLNAQQPNAWAGRGGVPIFFGAMTSVSCTVEFGAAPADAVGRHGGLIFCGTTATHRYAPAFSGYFADWIDRIDDHGFRVFRVDRGVHTLLMQGTPDIADPITLLQYQFAQGKPPPPPFDACGEDRTAETPDLGCASFPPCAR
ncbi:MAG TPA: hypothetical protein DCM87_17070 [Planctomycetes bacterium]|nr:hypothetical protein [Planctomycetota bacterium]